MVVRFISKKDKGIYAYVEYTDGYNENSNK